MELHEKQIPPAIEKRQKYFEQITSIGSFSWILSTTNWALI
eukprot:UN03249